MPRPAPDAFAQDRIERRAKRHGQALVVGEDRQCQTNERIDRPTLQTPVVDGADDADILVPRLGRSHAQRGRVPAFREVVVDRLAHAEEQEANADACREHHRDPARIGIVRHGILAAYSDRPQRQHQDGGLGPDGVGGLRQPLLGPRVHRDRRFARRVHGHGQGSQRVRRVPRGPRGLQRVNCDMKNAEFALLINLMIKKGQFTTKL